MKKGLKLTLGVLAALTLLAADAWVTARLTSTPVRAASANVSGASEADPVIKFRTEREQLRARQEAQLNDIIHDERSSEVMVQRAQEQLLSMLKQSELETTLEGILQSRGFEDALVTVHAASVNVMFRCEALTRQQSAVILELVLRETGVTSGNVKIIPIK